MPAQEGAVVYFDRNVPSKKQHTKSKLLPSHVQGTIVRVIPWQCQVVVSYDDEYLVKQQATLPFARVSHFGADAAAELAPAPVLLESKELRPLPAATELVASPTVDAFRNQLFAIENSLLRWFSRHCIRALRARVKEVAAVPIDSPLDAPYRHLAAQFAAFDIFFVDSVLAALKVDDARRASRLARANGLIKLLLIGYKVTFWPAALMLWRRARQLDRDGGQRLLRECLALLAETGHHSCLQCMVAMDRCSHQCCRQQFLLVGLNMGVLVRDNGRGRWRVAEAMQSPSASLPGPIPESLGQLPPFPMTWEKLLQQRLPVAWPPTKPTRQLVRVLLNEGQCCFDDLADWAETGGDGQMLRKRLASFISARSSTKWLRHLFTESNAPGQLADHARTVVKKDHAANRFDLLCLCLLLHVDFWVIEPVWDGPPEFPVQLRAAFPGAAVPAEEIAGEDEQKPKACLVGFFNKIRPLSHSPRNVYARVQLVSA